ncbi:FUSC family protein [Microbulbifer guangxiensis]|uniref:FUSC family protein n=1 Tax=Microbulbifer guangxiensis TaxID=2904249 RepID=UPI001F3DFAD6|nr:FUSC family protein [Microbulbifer guangxiensis]
MLSLTAREGIKLALALTLTYAIALSAGWEKPLWAGIAVVVASQVNLGQSLTRGALRVMGTVLGVFVVWILFVLFPQDRWIFMVSLSLWIGLNAYLMQQSEHQYFWQVAALSSLVIWSSSGADFSASFDKGVERALETTLGVVVYSLIALLIWPVRSRPALDDAAVDLANAQQNLGAACFSQLQRPSEKSSLGTLKVAVLEAGVKLDGLLRDARVDSFEVWERRQQWGRYGRETSAVTSALLRLSDSLESVSGLDVQELLPDLPEFTAEIERRLISSRKMLAGEQGIEVPAQARLLISTSASKDLSAFKASALSDIRSKLLDVEIHTRQLIACIRNIENPDFSNQLDSDCDVGRSAEIFVPDPERLVNVARILIGLWGAYLAYLYLPGFPGGEVTVVVAAILFIFLAMLPPVPITIIAAFFSLAMIFAAFIYFFIIIKLNSFYGLAFVIFGWTFSIYYLLSTPRLQPVRVIILLFSQVVIGIQNEQPYSFTSFLTLFMACMIALLFVSVFENIPFSKKAEYVFTRQIRQFFRSSAYLMSRRPGVQTGWVRWMAGWRRLYHRRVVNRMPRQLSTGARNVLLMQVPGVSKHQLMYMVNLIRLIGDQVLALDNNKIETPTGTLSEELKDALTGWHGSVQTAMRDLADTFSSVPSGAEPATGMAPQSGRSAGGGFDELRRTQREALECIEGGIQHSLRGKEIQLSILSGRALSMNILNEARHLSGYLVEFSDVMDQVDWDRFLESRFTH